MRCCSMERLFHQYYDQEELRHSGGNNDYQSDANEPTLDSKQEDSPIHLKLETKTTESLGPENLLPDH